MAGLQGQRENPFVAFVRTFRDRRVDFVRLVLKAEPYAWQREVLEALDAGEKRLSIRSGHGVGKSTLIAWVVLHYLVTTVDTKIALTAPSKDQLQDAVGNEIKSWLGRMPEPWPNLFEAQSEKIYLKSSPSEVFATLRVSRSEKPEALQGIHAAHVILAVDESSGVPDEIWEAAFGSLSTPGAIAILTGNPTRTNGFFHRTHTVLADRWWTKKVSSLDVPNVDKEFIEDARLSYGEDSNFYRVRVLGEFPLEDDDSVIPLYLVENAVKRDIRQSPDTPVVWGLDIARFGDDSTVLAKRQGDVLTELKVWRNKNSTEVADLVKMDYEDTPERLRPQHIFCDVIGVGAGVVDRLRLHDCPAIGINVAESPSSVKYKGARLRDELWLKGRDWFQSLKCRIPDNPRLIADLTGPRFTILDSGKLKVESKREMKARGVKSPDLADALLLTFARQASISSGILESSHIGSINKRISTAWVV